MTEIPTPSDLLLGWRRRAVALGLSHRDVDERADLPDGYFSKLLAGLKMPQIDTAIRVCRALDLRLNLDIEIAALKGGDKLREYAESLSDEENRDDGKTA